MVRARSSPKDLAAHLTVPAIGKSGHDATVAMKRRNSRLHGVLASYGARTALNKPRRGWTRNPTPTHE